MLNYNKIWSNYLQESDLDVSGLAPKSKLHPKFWKNAKIDPKVRRNLLKIAQDVAKEVEIGDFIEEIILTGSICSFNWHNMSDVDLHLLLDFSKVDENAGLVKKYLDSKKTIWNKNHDIMIHDHEVEIYFQDINEKHEAAGIYSLTGGVWSLVPQRLESKLDIVTAEKKADSIFNEIGKIQELFTEQNYKLAHDLASKLKKKIKNMRSSGLLKGGYHSAENLAFKILRNNGLLEILSTVRTLSYDKMMSVDGISVRIT